MKKHFLQLISRRLITINQHFSQQPILILGRKVVSAVAKLKVGKRLRKLVPTGLGYTHNVLEKCRNSIARNVNPFYLFFF